MYFQKEIWSLIIKMNLMTPKSLMVQKSFQMKVWTLMIQGILMITKSPMIQREFQLEVRTLIIQKSTVIPQSSMVLYTYECLIAYWPTSGLPFLRNRSCLEGNIWKRNIFGPSRRSKKEKENVDYIWS